MCSSRRVLGLDLAMRRYRDVGTAMVAFDVNQNVISVETAVLEFPNDPPAVRTLARMLAAYIEQHDIHALAIDATLAWREPTDDLTRYQHPPRPGVGRWAEKLLRTQSKTGPLGVTYPKTQSRWTNFGIELAQTLIHSGVAEIVNDSHAAELPPLSRGRAYILESYPTATWRASGLKPLPGKSTFKSTGETIERYIDSLVKHYPLQGLSADASHDDLQAVVAALPAVAILGGPCDALAYGLPMQYVGNPPHPVEGLVWIAQPSRDLSRDP